MVGLADTLLSRTRRPPPPNPTHPPTRPVCAPAGVSKVEYVVGMLTRAGLVAMHDVEPFMLQFDKLDTDGSGLLTGEDLATAAEDLHAKAQSQQAYTNLAHMTNKNAPGISARSARISQQAKLQAMKSSYSSKSEKSKKWGRGSFSVKTVEVAKEEADPSQVRVDVQPCADAGGPAHGADAGGPAHGGAAPSSTAANHERHRDPGAPGGGECVDDAIDEAAAPELYSSPSLDSSAHGSTTTPGSTQSRRRRKKRSGSKGKERSETSPDRESSGSGRRRRHRNDAAGEDAAAAPEQLPPAMLTVAAPPVREKTRSRSASRSHSHSPKRDSDSCQSSPASPGAPSGQISWRKYEAELEAQRNRGDAANPIAAHRYAPGLCHVVSSHEGGGVSCSLQGMVSSLEGAAGAIGGAVSATIHGVEQISSATIQGVEHTVEGAVRIGGAAGGAVSSAVSSAGRNTSQLVTRSFLQDGAETRSRVAMELKKTDSGDADVEGGS